MYESFDTLCIYLESDQGMAGGASASAGAGGGGGSSSAASDVDRNFWVRYKIGIVNQRAAERSVWKEASICTRTWNNSVLQLMKVPELMDAEAGFLVRDAVIFVCDVLDCCPWFEFSDLEVRGWLAGGHCLLGKQRGSHSTNDSCS